MDTSSTEFADPFAKLDSLSLEQVEQIWTALGDTPWGPGSMYDDEAGITMDDWCQAVYSRLSILRQKNS
jgi:hypothetical protein